MKILFAKCIAITQGFLDDLDTLLMGLLFLRFEHKLKRLAQEKEEKHAKILKAKKEYESAQKMYEQMLENYKTIQQHGI